MTTASKGEPAPRTFARSRDDRMLGGVCAGLADHLGLPVRTVRMAMTIFALLGGAGILLYAWLWALAPQQGEGEVRPMRDTLTRPAHPEGSVTARQRESDLGEPASARAAARGRASGSRPPLVDRAAKWPIAELLLGTCLLTAGIVLVLVQLGVEIRLDVILPALAVLVGVGLTWWQFADRDRPDRRMVPRVLGAIALVAVGVLMFFVTSEQPSTFTVIAAAIAVLGGVALAVAPWLLRLNRELIAERSGRAREAERAEIAAHLHDSVLQTLAAIQQRSEPGSEVARLARGQERDLREWLFRTADGAVPPERALPEDELREHAAMLEADHAVRFEVVSVGSGGSGTAVRLSMPLEPADAPGETHADRGRTHG